MFFITPAFAAATDAATATADAGPNALVTMAPLLLVFLVMYVLVLRPQNKRMEQHRKTMGDLAPGDKVVTGGGIIATVKKVASDTELVLEIAPGTQVTVVRQTIMMLYQEKK